MGQASLCRRLWRDERSTGVSRIGVLSLLAVLFSLSFLGLGSASALADTGEEIAALPVLDSFERNENPLSNGGKWTAVKSAQGTGRTTVGGGASGWGPYDAYPTLNGAYWNPSSFSDTEKGDAAAVTMQAAPNAEYRYVALWLNMSNPGTERTGYQLRWRENPDLTTYEVKLLKWTLGNFSVLASNSAVSIPAGTTMAISDTGGTVTAWKGTGGSLTSLLSATNSTFSSGYAGIEGSGNISRSINFKAGAIGSGVPSKPSVTTISPSAVANNNSPTVGGTAAAGTTVKLFTNSGCTGSPTATGSAATFASPGIAVSVADNTTTTFYATATNGAGSSPCSTSSVTYTEDSVAPGLPTLTSTNPASPANNNSPKIIGSAEGGSTVKLFPTAGCTGSAAATGSAASFASPGLTVSVADDSTTTYRATATDAAGNVSSCSSSSIAYVEVSTCPLTASAPGAPVEMTMPGCKLVASDTTAESEPYVFWGSLLQCASPLRYSTISSEGDAHLTAIGASQSNTAYRRMTVLDGDDFYGERCELGENDHRTGPTVFYHEGEHRVTYISERLPSNFPLSNPNWQTVMQMKQAQPSDGGGDGPMLEMQVRESEWVIMNNWKDVWYFPAKANTWTRFAWDVYYSRDPEKGWLQVSADLNGDGDFGDSEERSSVLHVATLKTEIEGPNGGSDGIVAGESIPSHLRAGIYHNSIISCPSPGGCSTEVDNVQVVAPQ